MTKKELAFKRASFLELMERLDNTENDHYNRVKDKNDYFEAETDALFSRLDAVFKEYRDLFGSEREIEIKKQTLCILQTLVPEEQHEAICVELYELDGRDYLAEKAKQKQLEIDREKEQVEKRKLQLEEELIMREKRKVAAENRRLYLETLPEGAGYRGTRTWIIDDGETQLVNEQLCQPVS